MASLFQLFGEIMLNNDDANKKIDQTTSKAESSGTSIGQVASGIGKTAAVIGGAAVAGVTALTGLAMKTADSAGAINDASMRVGADAEEYQRWAYAAGLCGMSSETLEGAMKKSQTTFAKAKDGNAAAADSYKALGINIENVSSSDEAFNQTMNALAGMTDETARNKAAMDIFGKSYADLGPLLNEGADGMKTLKDQATVMSDEQVAAGDQLGDTIDRLKNAGAGIMNSLGSAVIPIVQQVADLIIANLPMIQGLFEQLLPVFASLIQTLLPPLIQLAQTLLPPIISLIQQLLPFITEIVSSILPVFTELLNMILPPLMQIIEAILPLILSLIEPLLPLLDPILQLLQPMIDLLLLIVEPLIELINLILPPLISLFTNIMQFLLPGLQGTLSGVADILGGVFRQAFANVKTTVETLKTVFSGITDFLKNVFQGNWSGAWNAVKDTLSTVFNSFKDVIRGPVNAVIDLINSFIGKINGIKIDVPDWVTSMTGIHDFKLNIPKMARLKVGMDYVPYDEYPALLHEGEAVLTKQENSAYREGKSGTVQTYAPVINISISGAKAQTGRELLELIQDAVEEKTFGIGGAPSWATTAIT